MIFVRRLFFTAIAFTFVTQTAHASWRCRLVRAGLISVGATGIVELTFRPGRDWLRAKSLKKKESPVPENLVAKIEAGMKKFKAIRGDSGKRKQYFQSLLAEEKDEAFRTKLKNEIETNRLGQLFHDISRESGIHNVSRSLDELYALEAELYYKLFETREIATIAFNNFHNE